MGNTLAIYAFGEGDFLLNVLLSVVKIMNEPTFGMIIKVAVLLGIFILLWQLVFTFNIANLGLGMIRHYFYIMIVWYVLFVPIANVQIVDLVNPTQGGPVNNVPYGLAIFGHVFSSIEKGITELFDDSFYTVIGNASWEYSKAGYSFPLVVVDTLKEATLTDPYVKMTLNDFITNCFFLDVLSGGINLNSLINAGSAADTLWTRMQPSAFNQNFYAKIYSSTYPTGQDSTCGLTYTSLGTSINAQTALIANILTKTTGKPDGTDLSPYINDLLKTTGMSQQNALTQAIVANMMTPAMETAAVQNGISGDALAYATALAQQQQRTSWAVAGELAKKYIPIVRQVMLALLYGTFPLLFILMFVPWGMTYLKLFGTLFIWLAMWAPLYSILNFIVQLRAENLLKPSEGVFSLGNMPYIYQSTNDLVAMSGYLSWSVPMLAFAIAKGSEYALTNVIGGITSSSQGSASSAASQITGPDVSAKTASAAAHFRAAEHYGQDTYQQGLMKTSYQSMSNSVEFGKKMNYDDIHANANLDAATKTSDLNTARLLSRTLGQSFQEQKDNEKLAFDLQRNAAGGEYRLQGIRESANALGTGVMRNLEEQKAYSQAANFFGATDRQMAAFQSGIQARLSMSQSITMDQARQVANDAGISDKQFYGGMAQAMVGDTIAKAAAGNYEAEAIKQMQQAGADLQFGQMKGLLQELGKMGISAQEFSASKSAMDTIRTGGAIQAFKEGKVSAQEIALAGAVALQADAGNALAQQKMADIKGMDVKQFTDHVKSGQLANDAAKVDVNYMFAQALNSGDGLKGLYDSLLQQNSSATFGLTKTGAEALNHILKDQGIKNVQFKAGDKVSLSLDPQTQKIGIADGTSGAQRTALDYNKSLAGQNHQTEDIAKHTRDKMNVDKGGGTETKWLMPDGNGGHVLMEGVAKYDPDLKQMVLQSGNMSYGINKSMVGYSPGGYDEKGNRTPPGMVYTSAMVDPRTGKEIAGRTNSIMVTEGQITAGGRNFHATIFEDSRTGVRLAQDAKSGQVYMATRGSESWIYQMDMDIRGSITPSAAQEVGKKLGMSEENAKDFGYKTGIFMGATREIGGTIGTIRQATGQTGAPGQQPPISTYPHSQWPPQPSAPQFPRP